MGKIRIMSIVSVICSASLYLIVITSTLNLIYFTSPFFRFVTQNFSQYAIIIELIIGLIAFSIIPGLYVIRKVFKEENVLKIKEKFIFVIALLSAVPAMLSYINNMFTGNFLFSSALIIYGITFAAVAFKFR